MSIDVEYAIKKDVRNNPIVREVDRRQRRALAQTLGIGMLVVSMLLFSAWQHYQIIDHSYRVQHMLSELAAAEALNRRLQLEVDSLRAPALVEQRAKDELRMVYPTAADTLVIERIAPATASKGVVAHAR
jgi:cell division protein FtsL